MAKTYFSTGSIIDPDFLNALNNPRFTGEDKDGHFPLIKDTDLEKGQGSFWDRFTSYIDEFKVNPVSGAVDSTSALLRVAGGQLLNSSNQLVYSLPTTVAVQNNQVSLVWVDDLGQVGSGLKQPEASIVLARVTVAGGTLGEIEDLRERIHMRIPKASQKPAETVKYSPIGDWLGKGGRAYTITQKVRELVKASADGELGFLWTNFVGLLSQPGSEPTDISATGQEIFLRTQQVLTVDELIVFREYLD